MPGEIWSENDESITLTHPDTVLRGDLNKIINKITCGVIPRVCRAFKGIVRQANILA